MQFQPFTFDESISGQTWVARALDAREFPPVDRPWPVFLQSGRDPDLEIWLPDASGDQVASGEGFVSAQQALEAQLGTSGVSVEFKAEVVRSINPMQHTTYAVDVPGSGAPLTLYSFNKNRGYSLIVNVGANNVQIAYGKDAGATDLTLASGGAGFHELVQGTVSQLSVFAAAAAPSRVVIVEGVYYPPVY